MRTQFSKDEKLIRRDIDLSSGSSPNTWIRRSKASGSSVTGRAARPMAPRSTNILNHGR